MPQTILSLLLVEDSPDDRVLIEQFLGDVGGIDFALTPATTLSGAFAFLDDAPCDAALLDLSLPDSHGIATFRRLADHAPRLPIVVLTGFDDEQLAIQAVQQGAQDYLVKGRIDGEVLSRAVRYAIERKRTEFALQQAKDLLEQRVEERTAELKQMQEEARQRHEELAHATRLNLLGGLATGMAHELNQPLMSIVGFVDHCLQRLAQDQLPADHLRDMLQDISAEAIRAGEIIRRLRRLVGKHPSNRSPTQLNDVVEESVTLLERELSKHRIRLQRELAPSVPAVGCDRVQIQQVLLNLLQNAVAAHKNSATAEPCIIVRTRHDAAASVVEVSVSDNGPGVPADRLERLFEPFYTTKSDGLGLGLSISRSIVESHAGRLAVHVAPEGGLEFRMTLPTTTGSPDAS